LLQFQIKISQPGCMMHHPETYKCSIKRKTAYKPISILL
jgi:hypothetical protein